MKSLKKEVKSKIQSRWKPDKDGEEKANGYENQNVNNGLQISNRPQSAQMNKQRTPHVGGGYEKNGEVNPQFQSIINIENARPRSSDSRSSLAVIKEEDFEQDKGAVKKHAKVHPNDNNYYDRNLDTSPTLISRQRTQDSNFTRSRPGTGNVDMMKIHDLYDEVDLADEARHIREVHSKMPSTAGHETNTMHDSTSKHRKSSVTLTKVRPIITRPWRRAVLGCNFFKKLEKINTMLQCLTMLTIIGGTIAFLILYCKFNKVD